MFDDLQKKAEELAAKGKEALDNNKDKIDGALKSEKAEEVSDKVLDGAASFANKVTGGKFSDKINETRDNLDGKIGNE